MVTCLAQAIAHNKGYYLRKPVPMVSQRLNNPGELEHWKSRKGVPMPVVNGYVKFASEEDGFFALTKQIQINLRRDLSFREFFAGRRGVYAGFSPRGRGDNDPVKEAALTLRYVLRNLPDRPDLGGAELTIDCPILHLVDAEPVALAA
jgi:hypothetical protein